MSENNFKAIASVVYLVHVTKICEQFVTIHIFKSLWNTATQMIGHHAVIFIPIWKYFKMVDFSTFNKMILFSKTSKAVASVVHAVDS